MAIYIDTYRTDHGGHRFTSQIDDLSRRNSAAATAAAAAAFWHFMSALFL